MTTDTTTKTRGQVHADDVCALLRARNPLIWIVTREEARVEQYLFGAALAAKYVARTWDVAAGVQDMQGAQIGIGGPSPDTTLDAILSQANLADAGRSKFSRCVWIMRDLAPWLQGPTGMTTVRQLRNLSRKLPTVERDNAQAIIIISPSAVVPDELAGHATVIEWQLPDRAEIASILDAAIETLPDNLQATAAPNGQRDAAIDAAIGLSGEEAQSCYARSLVQYRRIDPAAVAAEKKRVITRERVLEWFDPLPGGLDAVGGLENLKAWLNARRGAYSPEARAYGLPAPKGAFLAGVWGCGKSLTAKAIATAWGVPLLRFDMGALKSKFVGESEANIRKAFAVIGAIGRCVVWFDEIEKALQGATSGSSDGGTSSDALGALLSWMQERQGEAFVIATANKVDDLPPELLRKGRFDEVWFVDLPNATERAAVLATALRAHDKVCGAIDLKAVAQVTEGFTGAELAALVPDALYAAFAQKARKVVTADLLTAAESVTPLSKTKAEDLAKLQKWGSERARPASLVQAAKSVDKRSRQVELA